MTSQRVQRRIERLLDEAEQAADRRNWPAVRQLGEAAILLGQHDGAHYYFLTALEACERIRYRPEIVLIRLVLAEPLLEHYRDERAEAIEHLEFAIADLGEMKMQPALERPLRHRGSLKG